METQRMKTGDRLSHAYIVASPSGEERQRAAKELCGAMLCSAGGKRPCGVCTDCRKVLRGTHPDVIFIRRLTNDKGKLNKDIRVDQIRELSSDSRVLPNEAGGKVYVLEEAELMNAEAQNALLKLLEEPPAGVSFILCSPDAGRFLPTVRSRCAVLRVRGETAETADATAAAREFLKAVETGDALALADWSWSNGGADNAEAVAFVTAARDELAAVLRSEGCVSLPSERCLRLAALLERCSAYLKVNTGVRHVYGLLAADALDGSEK